MKPVSLSDEGVTSVPVFLTKRGVASMPINLSEDVAYVPVSLNESALAVVSFTKQGVAFVSDSPSEGCMACVLVNFSKSDKTSVSCQSQWKKVWPLCLSI